MCKMKSNLGADCMFQIPLCFRTDQLERKKMTFISLPDSCGSILKMKAHFSVLDSSKKTKGLSMHSAIATNAIFLGSW